jgi:hypothetical protein
MLSGRYSLGIKSLPRLSGGRTDTLGIILFIKFVILLSAADKIYFSLTNFFQGLFKSGRIEFYAAGGAIP